MAQPSAKKKLEKHFKIYEQIYENPFILRSEIGENTGLSHRTVTRCLDEMSTVIYGPVISLKPALNYREHAYFLHVDNPLSKYEQLFDNSLVTAGLGRWSLSFTSEKLIDTSKLECKECILKKVKGETFLSRVTTLDWDESMRNMHDMLHLPQEKSVLNEKIPLIPWQRWDWAFYRKFRNNVRAPVDPVLEELGISRKWYRRWVSSLFDVANVQPAFYPLGMDKYHTFDFLFRSDYQELLVEILGMLPSTSLFFSVDEYILARLSILNNRELQQLFTFIYKMKREGFFTDVCFMTIAQSKERIPKRVTIPFRKHWRCG